MISVCCFICSGQKVLISTPLYPLIEFNAFAVQFRYEAYDMEDEPLDRGECIRRVKKLVDRVELLLKNDEMT